MFTEHLLCARHCSGAWHKVQTKQKETLFLVVLRFQYSVKRELFHKGRSNVAFRGKKEKKILLPGITEMRKEESKNCVKSEIGLGT